LGIWEVAFQLTENWESGIVSIHAEEDFVVRIVLAAEAREIFVGFGVKSKHRLDVADGRQEVGSLELRYAEIAKTAENCDAVIDERDRGKSE
jgi:hypothetical protein